jgi:hypothetical protein
MLRLISEISYKEASEEAKTGIEMILEFWQERKEKKYFLFGMGTDFIKLKAPFIWFDILHVADTLSRYDYIHTDKRFLEMIHLIEEKADQNGRFTPESVYMSWKRWDFGQKREPSAWITFLVYRLLRRIKKLTT